MKRMKKLIAALMAVAMIASLNISAFATTPAPFNTGGSLTANTDVSDTADKHIGGFTAANGFTDTVATSGTAAYNGATDKAQASVTSPVAYEGKMPEGVVHIVMPAVPANTFNMLLDPNDLIGEVAKGGDSATQRITGITNNTDYVYFHNAATENSEEGYSSSSDTLTITNKGYWPLNVQLTAEVTKGATAAGGSLIQMVSTKSALGQAKDYPALFMEVASGNTKKAVADAYGTPSITVATSSETGAKNLVIGSPIFTWADNVLNRDRKIINNALVAGTTAPTLKLSATSKTALADPEFANGGVDSTNKKLLKVDSTGAVNSETSLNTTEVSIAASSVATEKVDLSDGKAVAIQVYNIQLKKPGESSAKTCATLKVAVDAVNMSKKDTSVPVGSDLTFAASAVNSTGTTGVLALAAKPEAYMVTYSSNTYIKTLIDDAKNDDYAWPELSFNINAAINKSTAWDDMAATGAEYNVATISGLTTKVIWDVQNDYSKDDTINNGKPKVKVTKYAVNAGDSIEFKVDFGKGSKGAIALVSLDAGATKQIALTFGKPGTGNKITQLTGKDGKWQTFNEVANEDSNATTTGITYQCSPKAVSAGAKATLTYLKPDLTTDTIEFTYGASNA